jgi:hypothetical protein
VLQASCCVLSGATSHESSCAGGATSTAPL